MTISLAQFLIVAAILFTLGVAGVILNRKNIIVVLMSVELILLSVNLNLVAFSAFLGDLTGQIFALFILTVAAAEAAIGLAILVAYYRNRGSIAVDDINTTMMFLRFKITPATPSVNRMAATIKKWASEIVMMVFLRRSLRASLQCPISNSLPRGNLADLDRLGRCPRVLDRHVLAFHAGLVAQGQHDGADHGGQ